MIFHNLIIASLYAFIAIPFNLMMILSLGVRLACQSKSNKHIITAAFFDLASLISSFT